MTTYAEQVSGFSALLDEAMRARGLTMAEMARQLGVHLTFVDKMVKGKRPPPAERLEAMANALGLIGKAKDRFIDAGMLSRLEPVVLAWLERRGGRVPTLPAMAELGFSGNQATPPTSIGRPRSRTKRG